ncbi:MAG TPA: hypothetical protein VKM54_26605 [Myxococcota bacterium]|nr:hypothetical protein [Myxococcota bacterium]
MRSGVRSAKEAAGASDLQLALFMHMAEFNLGPMLDRPLSRNPKQIRGKTEKARHKPEAAYQNDEMSASEFADAFDEITLSFQSEMANTMDRHAYKTLFDLEPHERIVLTDPRIVKQVEKSRRGPHGKRSGLRTSTLG